MSGDDPKLSRWKFYEVRVEVLRTFNGWHFFINDNPTQNLHEIRKFYADCANDRMAAHQGRRPGREAFLRKVIDSYARAAEKANKKATTAAKGRKSAKPGRYGIQRVDWRVIDGKHQFFGVVTKAALAKEMQPSWAPYLRKRAFETDEEIQNRVIRSGKSL